MLLRPPIVLAGDRGGGVALARSHRRRFQADDLREERRGAGGDIQCNVQADAGRLSKAAIGSNTDQKRRCENGKEPT